MNGNIISHCISKIKEEEGTILEFGVGGGR